MIAGGSVEERRTDDRLRLLLSAGAALNDAPTADSALRALAQLACESFASVCVIDLRGQEGRTVRLAAIGAAPGIDVTPFRSAGVTTPRPTLPIASYVIDHRTPLHAAVLDTLFFRQFGEVSGVTSLLLRQGMHSLISAPILEGNNVHGALTLVRGPGDARAFERADLVAALDLGRRIGISYGSRRLFARERRIAMRLQEAMLPKELPELADARLDAVYLPGATELTVGGDWYDAFATENGNIVLTIGDVLGRGLDAAIMMSRLRQAMQSVALLDLDPAAMLRAADRTIRLNEPDIFATAIAAMYDPITRELRFASAGHPGPFERRADGTVIEHTNSGLPLGLREHNGDEGIRSFVAQAGSLIVFFTDGLIEATRDLAEGYDRVRAALRRLPVISERPAQRIADAVLREAAHDDVCILTLDTDGGMNAVPPLTTRWRLPSVPT